VGDFTTVRAATTISAKIMLVAISKTLYHKDLFGQIGIVLITNIAATIERLKDKALFQSKVLNLLNKGVNILGFVLIFT